MDLPYLHREHVGELSRDIATALEKTGFSALAVHSGAPLKRTDADDQYWPLRPTPHFQHWLPLAEAGCLLIAVPGRRPVLVRPPVQSFWEAPPAPESDHFWGSFEVVETVPQLPAGRVAFVGDDAGAAVAGYGSESTRTWVKGGGAAASAFSELVAGMEAMQQRLCSQVRVGMPYEELHDASHRQVAEILRQVGISRLPADELVSR